MSTIDNSIHYSVKGDSSKFQTVVTSSPDHAVSSWRIDFNSERFDDIIRYPKPFIANLRSFGYPTVTYITRHSFDDDSGETTPERALELEVLIQRFLDDCENSLVFIFLHDMYECDAPVFEKLGFSRRPAMEIDECMLYVFHSKTSSERV